MTRHAVDFQSRRHEQLRNLWRQFCHAFLRLRALVAASPPTTSSSSSSHSSIDATSSALSRDRWEFVRSDDAGFAFLQARGASWVTDLHTSSGCCKKYDAFLKHWKKATGLPSPESCSISACRYPPEHGARVTIIYNDSRLQVFKTERALIPTCHAHTLLATCKDWRVYRNCLAAIVPCNDICLADAAAPVESLDDQKKHTLKKASE